MNLLLFSHLDRLKHCASLVDRFNILQQSAGGRSINSKALNPRQNLAIALIEQKKYAQAIEHLNEAMSIDSSSPTAHLYAGIASLGIDEIDQAERELSTALSIGSGVLDNTPLPYFQPSAFGESGGPSSVSTILDCAGLAISKKAGWAARPNPQLQEQATTVELELHAH